MSSVSHTKILWRDPANRWRAGLGLIEGVIAVAIVGTALVAMVGIFQLFLRTALQTTPELKAVFLMEEGFEAMRAIRDTGWQEEINPLVLDTPYYLDFTTGRWEVLLTPVYTDDTFERTVTLSSVNRDSDGRIVTSGGTADTHTKKITVAVSWSTRGATTTKTASGYLMDVFDE